MAAAERSAYSEDALVAATRERSHAPLALRERAVRWTTAATFVAAALALVSFAPSSRSASPYAFAVAIIAYAAAYSIDVETVIGSVTPTGIVFVPMLFALPARTVPLVVAIACALAQLVTCARTGDPLEKVVVAVGNAWFALAPALVVAAFNEPSATKLQSWAIIALALAAQLGSDLVRIVVAEWFALNVPPRVLIGPIGQVAIIDLMLAPVGLLIAVAGGVTSAAFLLPLPLLALLALYAHERSQRFDQQLELSDAYRGTALLLGDVVEADDAYTGAHSRDVVELVVAVCEGLRIDRRDRLNAEFTALLHDVGKITVPAEIINKPGPLNADEWAVMRRHTIEGQRLLERVGGRLAEVGALVRACHEHWDGGGYPDGLTGTEIPLVARIVCCCDAFSAMTTDRAYRAALTHEQARAELEACAGSQFDPQVVHALLTVLERRNPVRVAQTKTLAPPGLPLSVNAY